MKSFPHSRRRSPDAGNQTHLQQAALIPAAAVICLA
jgi:hypothetical protein